MICNDTISLFDSVEIDDGIKILQYIISNVYLEKTLGAKLSNNGEYKGYNATLFIPDCYISDDKYVKPKEWGIMSLDDKLTHFTIRPNQVVVHADKLLNYNSLDDILNNEDDAFRVIGFECLSKVLPHFEVLCK